MEPSLDERFPGQRFALRDLIFVMRKDQVRTAGVNVEVLAQVFHRHGGAFDMPARPPAAERRVPARFALFACFPEDEVANVFLVVFVHVHSRPGSHAADVDSR